MQNRESQKCTKISSETYYPHRKKLVFFITKQERNRTCESLQTNNSSQANNTNTAEAVNPGIEDTKESLRKFKCSFPGCPKRYKNKSILKKHYITHFANFEHRCHFYPCMKQFKSRENLDLHISNTHLSIKPYKCGFCKRVFSHRNGKTYHERTKHLNFLPYKCKSPGCEKQYANKYGLNSHTKTAHKNC